MSPNASDCLAGDIAANWDSEQRKGVSVLLFQISSFAFDVAVVSLSNGALFVAVSSSDLYPWSLRVADALCSFERDTILGC